MGYVTPLEEDVERLKKQAEACAMAITNARNDISDLVDQMVNLANQLHAEMLSLKEQRDTANEEVERLDNLVVALTDSVKGE